MRPAWPEVALGDVCELRYGRSLPKDKRLGSSFGVFGSNGEVGRHEQALTAGPTIVVGRKGSFGEVTFSAEPCWPIDTTYYVDATATKADLRWLYYRMKALPLRELNRAAAIPGLNRDDAYAQRTLLPPIEEQWRIAAVLDAADALRAKRRQALAKLDILTQAIFIDMFVRAEAEWEFVPVESVAASKQGAIRTGPFGSQLLHEEFVAEGIAVLGIDNAVQNRFSWGERRYITPEKFSQLQRYQVFPQDVLVTIMGTCGRVAIVPDDIPTAINTKHLCCITVDRARCLPEFLWGSLRFHPRVLHQLGATHGAVMPGLNMGRIKTAEIPVPPLELQQQFAERKAAAEAVVMSCTDSLGELCRLFCSLQQRAFRAEL